MLCVYMLFYSQFMVIKKSTIFDRLEENWKVMLKDMYDETAADRNKVVIPVLEEHGVSYFKYSRSSN